jgi:hypothetical protein
MGKRADTLSQKTRSMKRAKRRNVRVASKADLLPPTQQRRQLRDVRRNPPRLIAQGAGNKVWALGFSAGVT